MGTASAELAGQARALLAAHHAATPLILPNAWDVASARAVEAAGFAAVASSSRAVAASLGEPDDDTSDPDLIFDVLGRMAGAVRIPVTADLQAGLRLEPGDLVDRIVAAGLAGCNLEDTDHHGPGVLVDAEDQAAYLAAVRQAADTRGIHLVINARVDAFVRGLGDEEAQLAEGIRRGRRYLAAGADCVFPISLGEPVAIRSIVEAVPGPLNIIARPGGLTISQLAELGVHRISTGGGIHQLLMADLGARLRRLAAGELAPGPAGRPVTVRLETERLTLLPLPAEAAAVLPANRQQARRILGARLDPDWPLDDIAGNLRLQAAASPGEEPYGVWVLLERATNTVVGEAGFEGHPAAGTVELFFSVVPSRRRRGYATEAARALVSWAFRQPAVDHVHARCQPQNFASIATLKQAGFHLTREEDGLLHWRATDPAHPEPRHWWLADRRPSRR